MFGHVLPGDSKIISIRDAADRASRVSNPDEAATLMNLAEMNGDEVLLKALARECAERANPLEPGYGALFTQWASNQPGGSETLDEMAMIIHEFSDPGARLVRESVFSVGPLPGHLRGISDLRALAAEADDTSGVLPPTSAQKTGDHLSAFVRADIR
ncbi:MAG: hypothetical protein JO176_02835 [Acidimicrobiia bacterium]|nr:hypothetical protein [Pseudonocardiales bacterium]MBV9283525.1 hypothetical protein [Acidimicrobiia bacterium]